MSSGGIGSAFIVRRVPMPYTLDCDGMVDNSIVTLYAPLPFSFEGDEAIVYLERSFVRALQ